jgi:hypothetical protein
LQRALQGIVVRIQLRTNRSSLPVLVKMQLPLVMDEFTRELLVLRMARWFTSRATKVVLGDVFADYGTPEQVRSDNRPEFISRTTRK